MLFFFVELSKPIKIVLKNHSMTSFQISHVKSVIVIDKKILTVNDGFAYSFCFQTTTNFQFCHRLKFFRMKKLYILYPEFPLSVFALLNSWLLCADFQRGKKVGSIQVLVYSEKKLNCVISQKCLIN